MKKLLPILLLFIAPITIAQPNFEWIKSIGGTGYDVGMDIVVDNSGNSYIIGEFSNTVDFDPGAGVVSLTSLGSYDIFLQKLDPNGNLLWVKQFGGTNTDDAISIALDGNGGLIITGHFRGSVDFDPSAGTFILTAAGSFYDTYVAKLDNNGNLIWAKQIDATDSCMAIDLAVNSIDEVIITGRWYGTADFDPGAGTSNLTATGTGWDTYILKLSSAGTHIWVKQITCTADMYTQAIAIDNFDNVLLTGYYYNTIDVDPGPGTVNYMGNLIDEDMFILKLNNSGIYVWSQNFSSSSEVPLSVHVDENNDYYFGGYFSAALDFDASAGTAIVTPAGGSAGFLLKLNSSGLFQWVNQLNSDIGVEVNSVRNDSQGDLIISGVFWGTADLDPSATTTNYTSAGNRDIFFQKVSPNGLYSWSQTMGGTGNDVLSSVTIGPNDEIYSTGNYIGTSDFDPGIGVFNVTSVGSVDVFVHKLNVCMPGAPIPSSGTLPNLVSECSMNAPTPPTATKCGQTYNGVSNVTFPITTQGTTVVTWTYDDGNGNTSTQTQNVIIDDVTAPVPNNASLASVNAECSVTSLTAPTATDNCAGTITGTHNASLPITTQGTTVVTWTYNDGNGNTSIQTQNVIIDDVTAPIAVAANLSNITSECEVTSLTAPTATDNCAGTVTGTHNASLPITTQGTTVVTWTYNDGNGNTSTQTQNVIIDDVTAPIADAANLSDITSECDVTSLTAPTATDNCAGSITGTHNATLPITAPGTTVVTWTYDDGNGNTVIQTQNVIITPIDNGITQVDAVTLSADATGYNYQWIDCDNGNQPINGATNQTFTATTNGNYAVEIDNGACTVVSTCLVIDEVGIKEIWETELVAVYPNPTTGTLNIESKADIQSIELMDALGQLIKIYSTIENKIEINTAPGVYFLRITTEGQENNIRVVKQ